jgi:hypothetical protein
VQHQGSSEKDAGAYRLALFSGNITALLLPGLLLTEAALLASLAGRIYDHAPQPERVSFGWLTKLCLADTVLPPQPCWLQ